jgi:hypothetical protein
MVGAPTLYRREPCLSENDRLPEAELRSLTPVDITHEDDRRRRLTVEMAGQPYVHTASSAIGARMAASSDGG